MSPQSVIDICAGCGGRLQLISLDQRERMRRRIGRAWIARCRGCGVEVEVNSQAWRTFVKERREQAQRRAIANNPQKELFT